MINDITIIVPGRIFGPVDPKDQVRQPIRRAEPTAPASRNIFTYEPPSNRPLVAHTPNKLGSSFSFSHDEGNKLSQQFQAANLSSSPLPPAGKRTPQAVHNIIG
jgi:hypothetical protein